MTAFLNAYYRFLQFLLTALMMALTVPVTMQILSRYTGLIPRYIWTEEIARFCFVWIVLIGAMIAVRDRSHFDVDLLPTPKTAKGKALAGFFVHGLMALVALTFVIYGYDFGVLGSRQRSEISGLPMLSIYIAWPVAGVTWLLFLGEHIARDWRLFKQGDA